MATHRAPTPPEDDLARVAEELIALLQVVITVQCEYDHVIGQWTGSISEKYPFYCNQCDDDKRSGRHPWYLTTKITARAPAPPDTLTWSPPPATIDPHPGAYHG